MFRRVVFGFALAGLLMASSAKADLVISGVVDGPLSGGTPKAIEFYVINDIGDLSSFGFGSANNGGGSDGEEFTFSGSASAGDFLYLSTNETDFNTFFGFNPTFTDGSASINGDDALELFQDGNVIDTFGDINLDGTGEPWEYLDGWAYRLNDTGPDDTTFNISSWTFSGPNALDGESDNGSATSPFPIGTFSITAIPEPGSFVVLSLAVVGCVAGRRRR